MKTSSSRQFWSLVNAKRVQITNHPDPFNEAIKIVSAEHPDLAAIVAAGPKRSAGFANSAPSRRG